MNILLCIVDMINRDKNLVGMSQWPDLNRLLSNSSSKPAQPSFQNFDYLVRPQLPISTNTMVPEQRGSSMQDNLLNVRTHTLTNQRIAYYKNDYNQLSLNNSLDSVQFYNTTQGNQLCQVYSYKNNITYNGTEQKQICNNVAPKRSFPLPKFETLCNMLTNNSTTMNDKTTNLGTHNTGINQAVGHQRQVYNDYWTIKKSRTDNKTHDPNYFVFEEVKHAELKDVTSNFQNLTMRKLVVKNSNVNYLYECPYCLMLATKLSDVIKHGEDCTKKKISDIDMESCDVCSKKFRSVGLFVKHILRSDCYDNKPLTSTYKKCKFVCKDCDEVKLTKRDLINHMHIVHRSSRKLVLEGRPILFKCPTNDCDFKSFSYNVFSQHVRVQKHWSYCHD